MKETRLIMGMPVTVEIIEPVTKRENLEEVFAYFDYVDKKFSTYKKDSEISRINRGELEEDDYSEDMRIILLLAEETGDATDGYFDIVAPDGTLDPSGVVKGWAIHNAAKILRDRGFKNFYVDAGGDVEVGGKNSEGKQWSIGIKNPFNTKEIVKVVYADGGMGVATSGTYIRGLHIWDPKTGKPAEEIASVTVVGPNIYEADRFATAAFAMGAKGIGFIEKLEGLEGYMINAAGIATMTSGFGKFTEA